MATRFKLRELEQQHGDLHKIIPNLVNERGQLGAAVELGTTQSTISNWLRDNGYYKREKWVRGTQTYEGAPVPDAEPTP